MPLDDVDIQSGTSESQLLTHLLILCINDLQGVIASGLAALSAATGNTTLLDQAEITLDATIQDLTQDDILKESCDDVVSGGSTCDLDQVRSYTYILVHNTLTLFFCFYNSKYSR